MNNMQQGMAVGAGTGALAGTAVMPGVGTVAGALGGAALGGLLAGGGQVDSYGGPTVDWSSYQAAQGDQYKSRMNQDELAAMLQQQAQGKGPSVANAQLQQSLQQNQAAQQSAANSARGGVLAQGAAQRQAQASGAQMQQQAAQQASVNRAQEQLGAQQQLQGLYNTQRGQDLQRQGLESSNALGIGGLQNQAAGINMQGQIANASNEQGMLGGMLNAAGGLFSDERVKTNIHPADEDMRRFLDALASKGPKSFEYRSQPGEHFGVMAQDLEQAGPVGRSLVKQDPATGYKTIDTTQGFGALLAANAQLEERLSRLEAMKGGK